MPCVPGASEPLLDITGLTLRFGGVQAVSDVDVRVSAGSICGVVGPNGAGKTSLFNCICGYYRPTAGTIRALGRDVTGIAPYRLAALGLARTFQHPALQLDASVLENVLAGGHTRIAGGPLSCALRLPRVRRDERALRAEARGLLRRLSLEDVAETPAGALAYGSQKRVELARALLARPRLLLVDELASGLTQGEVMELAELISALRAELDLTVLLVEHHMRMVAAVTDTVIVLVQGRKVAEGTAAQVQEDPVVVSAYLGEAA
jgi:branched-chain amino acid transport system ATP-binding protein